MTDNFKALIVTELVLVTRHHYAPWIMPGEFWEPREDFSFVNPEHVMLIRSLTKRILTNNEEGPVKQFCYEIHFTDGRVLTCIVDDRQAFYDSITNG